MAADNDPTGRAILNLAGAIDLSGRFPNNVFSTERSDFLFLDSDIIFLRQFAGQLRSLLDIEGSEIACLVNLDERISQRGSNKSVLLVTRETTNDQYWSGLNGSGPANGWVYGTDRYGCTSDIGQWCIYCEKASEIAVIAFRKEGAWLRCKAFFAEMGAVPFMQAIADPPSYVFAHMLPEWTEGFLRNYA